MSLTIGGNSFIDIRGHIDPPSQTFRATSQPGFDGEEIQTLGLRTNVQVLTCFIDCAAAGESNDVDARMVVYKAMEGKEVSIVLNGVTWTNCFVERVRLVDVKPIGTAVGGTLSSPAYMITVSITIRHRDLNWNTP